MEPIKWNGRKITHAGLYADVPLEVYHSQHICDGPSVSSSGLRRVLEVNGGSPAHFFAEWDGNPEHVEPRDSEAFILGRAAHHLLLGQKNFALHFIVRPPEFDSYRTKAAKQWRANEIAQGKTALTNQHVEAVRGMAVSLGDHPLIVPKDDPAKGLLGGLIECSMFWQDKLTGLWIKSRPDAIPTDSADFADLKTTTSVQYPDLVKTISDFAYHQQAALVQEGSEIVLEMPMSSFCFAFVEKTPPYCVAINQLKDNALDLGRRQNHSAMKLIARCLKENKWPGPGGVHIGWIELSERYDKEANERLRDP